MECERFLRPGQNMQAQTKMFENLTVVQTTGRKFSVVKLRKPQNILGKGETEYCTSKGKLFHWSNISKNGMFFPLVFLQADR